MDSDSEKRIDSVISGVAPSSTAFSANDDSAESGQNPSKSRPFIARCWDKVRFDRTANDQEYQKTYKTIVRKLDGCPNGYCKLSTFQNSDPNFKMYRGFDYLHCRLLASLQFDVSTLEKELKALDDWDTERNDPDGRLKCRENDILYDDKDLMPEDFDFERTRTKVLEELKDKLMAYDEVLLKAREMANLARPSARDYRSVKSWLINHKPIVDEEWEYIRHKEDIVSLRVGRECAGFDGFVEGALSRLDALLQKVHCNFVRNVFMTKSLREKTSDLDLRYYSPARVDTLVGLIITIIIFILLVLPVVAMYELSDIGKRASAFEAMGVLIIFTLIFGLAMSTLTKARRQELFAACAAYCAVLVVFISSFTPQTVFIAQ